MKNKTKKGYALIYVMVTVMILIVVTTCVCSLALSNRTTTAAIEKSNKAKLMAESGMERALGELKNAILTQSDNFVKIEKGLKDEEGKEVHFDVPKNITDSKYSITFTKADDNENIKKGIKCIKITSKSTYNGTTKSIDAYVDEKDITNKYYEKIFKKPETVYGDKILQPYNEDDKDSETIQEEALLWGSDNYKEGEIMMVPDPNKTDEKGNKLKPQLFVKKITSNTEFDLSTEVDNLSDYIRKQEFFTAEVETEKNNISTTYPDKELATENLVYSKYYKMIIVDGDAVIQNKEEPLVNYIIYCTGTLTIGDDIKIWNSSVNAKEIKKGKNVEIKEIGNKEVKDKIIGRLFRKSEEGESYYNDIMELLKKDNKTIDSLFPSGAATDFKGNRAYIDQYLIKNLKGYSKGFQFKIVDWIEK